MNEVDHLTRKEAENYELDNTFDGEGIMEDGFGKRQTFSEEAAGIQGIICDRIYAEDEEGEKLQVEIEERAVSLLDSKDYEEEAVTMIEGDSLDEEALNFSTVENEGCYPARRRDFVACKIYFC